MTDLVERVANAICRECRLMGDGIGSGAAAEAARAAIGALRLNDDDYIKRNIVWNYEDLDIFNGIIDAILTEGIAALGEGGE